MKANSYIKFTNILDRIQLYFDSLDLTKIGIRGSIFAHMSRLPIVTELKPNDANLTLSDSAKPTLLGETHAVGEQSETCRQAGTSARFHPLRERGNAGNRNLQKTQLVRRHRSINWRWQSRLIQWI
jgi:hypothetical protein